MVTCCDRCIGSEAERPRQQLDVSQMDGQRSAAESRPGSAPAQALSPPYRSPAGAYCPPAAFSAESAAQYAGYGAATAGYGADKKVAGGPRFVPRADLANYGYSAAAVCNEPAAYPAAPGAGSVICSRAELEPVAAAAARPVSVGSAASAGSAASDALELDMPVAAAPPPPQGYLGYQDAAGYHGYLCDSPSAGDLYACSARAAHLRTAPPFEAHDAAYERGSDPFERAPELYERPADGFDRTQDVFAYGKTGGELAPMPETPPTLSTNQPREYCPYSQPAYTSVIVDAQHYAAHNQYVH